MTANLVFKGWFTMTNYFQSAEKTPTGGLAAGTYLAVLKSIRPGQGKGYDGNAPRPTLTFSFETTKEHSVVNRTVNASRSERSKCLQLIRSMSGDSQPSDATIADPEKFSRFVDSLIGKEYSIQVQPSVDGRFNNLIGVMPVIQG